MEGQEGVVEGMDAVNEVMEKRVGMGSLLEKDDAVMELEVF